MLIGIDGNEANVVNRVGVNQYAFELLLALHKIQEEWSKKHRLIVYLKNKPLPGMPPVGEFFKYKVISGRGMWIITKLMPHLYFHSPRPDVFFSPSHYVPPFTPMPRVCSIMDLGYLEFSGQFKKRDYWQLKLWSAYSIFVSKAIIAISNSTKDDIVRHYSFASKKVHVTHLAHDKKKFNRKISYKDVRLIRKKYSIVGDYILFLGTLKPSKNVEGLLDAFSILKGKSKQFNQLKLVIAGKKGWLFETIFERVKALELNEDVIFTGFISEEDKPALLAGAKVFTLASFWEGFGLDVLSAMACGTPVVISDVGSLPEVGGKAAIYVDPRNSQSITTGLKKILLMNENEYNKLVQKSLNQAQKFSWEKTASDTLKVLENTVIQRPN